MCVGGSTPRRKSAAATFVNFRYDINGLRAIAVIAVVVFHFLPATLPGGFAGVDVFFVISGYLMTSIIVNGVKDNKFGLLRFYMARANRIVPALAVLCLAVLLAGWFGLWPDEFAQLGKHVAASIGFVSNIVYWAEAGYFDAASHQKILLHTWSLAVEWQFYLLYPLLIMALVRWLGVARLPLALLLLTVALLGYSLITAAMWPSASYFLLPARAWQLLAGGLVWLFPLKLGNGTAQAANWLGLAAIALAYAVVDETVPWPGSWAILPVAGTALVLVAARQDSWLTNNPASQALGRWSYSIYLWHWPWVVVGYRYDLLHWWPLGMALSLLCGWVSYRLVESIRWQRVSQWRQCWRAKPVWAGALVLIMGLGIMGQNGVPGRFALSTLNLLSSIEASPRRDECHIDSYQPPQQACLYHQRPATWAVLGDSHLVELAYALAERLAPAGQGVRHYSFSGCPPSLLQADGTSRCTRWYKEAVEQIVADTTIERVLIGHRYSWTLYGDHGPSYPQLDHQPDAERTQRIVSALDAVIWLLAAHKEQVVVIKPVPELAAPASTLVARAFARGDSLEQVTGTTRDYYARRNATILAHFAQAQYPGNVIFIDPTEAFCNRLNCQVVQQHQALYFDDNHPSLVGAQQLLELIPAAALGE